MLRRLHRFIRRELKKERSGFINPQFITDSINAASEDLWKELVDDLLKGKSSNLLNPFKSKNTINNGNSYTITGGSNHEIVSAELNNVEVIIARSDIEWANLKLEDYVGGLENINISDPKLRLFLDEATFSSGEATLSEFFAIAISVRDGNYQGMIVPIDKLYSKKLTDFHDPEKDAPSNLIPNTERVTISSFPYELDEDFVEPVSAFITLSDGSKHRGVIVSPDKFQSTQLEDLVPEGNKGKEYKHLFYDDYSFSIVAADNGRKDLPSNYVDHQNSFSHFHDGNTYEGAILENDEFLNRKNSVLMPPTVEDPIARIFNNKIEVFPKPTGSDTYNFALHYKKFNSERYPVFKIDNDELSLRGGLPSGAEVEFTFIKHPTARRPIAAIEGDKAFIRGTSTGTLTYLAFPSDKKPMIRYSKSDSNMVFEVKPDIGSEDINVFSVRPPELADASYSANGYGEVLLTVTDDLEWEDEAFSEIATRALLYLGVGNKDQAAAQIETIKEQNENANQ